MIGSPPNCPSGVIEFRKWPVKNIRSVCETVDSIASWPKNRYQTHAQTPNEEKPTATATENSGTSTPLSRRTNRSASAKYSSPTNSSPVMAYQSHLFDFQSSPSEKFISGRSLTTVRTSLFGEGFGASI